MGRREKSKKRKMIGRGDGAEGEEYEIKNKMKNKMDNYTKINK
jgi:hypothetical protein